MPDVYNLIIIGTAIMLILTFGIIFFVVLYQRRIIRHHLEIKDINEQNQRALIQASIQSEEEERARIAGELHDDVGVTLSSIRLFLHNATKTSTNPEIINHSRELLDQSIHKIRNLSHQLQPATIQYLGIDASFKSLADTVSKSETITMHYTSAISLNIIDEQNELALYRIVQELTNNIIKHASASHINLMIDLHNNNPHLLLVHNGVGLTNENFQELINNQGALGLKNMMNRLKSINAEISFNSSQEGVYETHIYTHLNS